MFQGPPFLKVGGSLGPNFIILDPSLNNRTFRVSLEWRESGRTNNVIYIFLTEENT